jgi:YVTN family beta-propeller protein
MKILSIGKLRSRIQLTLLAAVTVAVFFLMPTSTRAQVSAQITIAATDGSVSSFLRAEGQTELVPQWTQTLPSGYVNGICSCNGLLYCTNTVAGEVQIINPNTGAVSSTVIPLTDPWSAAFFQTSVLIGLQGGTIVKLDATTNTVSNADFINFGFFPIGMSVYNGDLYVFGNNEISVYDATSGAMVGGSPLATGVNGDGIDVTAGGIFISGGSGASLYSLTGTEMNSSLVSGLFFPDGIDADGSDLFVVDHGNFMVADSGSVGEYNTDGTVTNSALITGLDGPTSILVVPEPATWSLLAGGAAMLFAAYRRRKRA